MDLEVVLGQPREYLALTKLVPTKASISNFSVVYETDKGIYCLNQPKQKSSDVIAIDLNSNIEYTAADLINKKLILTYEIEDSDIIFCGQFDENNNWNGQCIINVYNNELLSLATEAEYNSGELLSYKQILPTSIAVYMYYQGIFKDGKPTHNNGYIFKNDINNKEIEEILHSEGIYEELIWYDGNA